MSRSGGTERVAANLCNRWAEDGKNIVIVAIEPGRRSFYPLAEKAKILSLDIPRPQNLFSWFTWYFRVVRKLRPLLKILGPDFVIGFSSNPSCCAIDSSLGLPLRAVAFEHMHCRYYWDNVSWSVRFVYFVRRLLYPLADAVVALTEKDRKYFARFCRRTFAIPNAITGLAYENAKIDYAAKRVLAVGRISKQKGFDLLLKAWEQIFRDYPEWELCIVGGKAPEEAAYIKQFEELAGWRAVSGSVRILPPVSNILEYYRSASVFVMSSRWEGFPMALLEAMCCGLAAVSFDCPNGPADLVNDEVNGLLVPPEDVDGLAKSLSRLMADESLRCRLGRAAADVRLAYAWENVSLLWQNLFRLSLKGE